jgi:hypothetical protein
MSKAFREFFVRMTLWPLVLCLVPFSFIFTVVSLVWVDGGKLEVDWYGALGIAAVLIAIFVLFTGSVMAVQWREEKQHILRDSAKERMEVSINNVLTRVLNEQETSRKGQRSQERRS